MNNLKKTLISLNIFSKGFDQECVFNFYITYMVLGPALRT